MLNKVWQWVVIGLAALTLIENIPFTWQWYLKTKQWVDQIETSGSQLRKPGYEYADLRPHLNNIDKIGYLTDYDLHYTKSSLGFFLTAQYTLIPTILEANQSDHEILLLDFQTLDLALDKAKALNAKPIFINPYQKVLVIKQ